MTGPLAVTAGRGEASAGAAWGCAGYGRAEWRPLTAAARLPRLEVVLSRFRRAAVTCDPGRPRSGGTDAPGRCPDNRNNVTLVLAGRMSRLRLDRQGAFNRRARVGL